MKFAYVVYYQRKMNNKLQRRIKRRSTHSDVQASSDKEARIMLISDYNKAGFKILKIERMDCDV